MNKLTLPLSALAQVESRWPGFTAHVTALGSIEGGALSIAADQYAAAWGAFYAANMPAASARGTLLPVTFSTKVRRAIDAMRRWAAGGFGFVERRARRQRQAACEACDAWVPSGNLGFGECRDPRCGCTRAKQWLPTETCPRGKWPK